MREALDFYSPVAMFLAGASGLFYAHVVGAYLRRHPRTYLSERIEKVHARFERNSRLSWGLIAFGALWGAQLFVESALAKLP